MGWPAHNPELYDEICKRGVRSKVRKGASEILNEEPDEDTLEAIIDFLFENSICRDALQSMCGDEIADAESNHFAWLADR